MVIHYNILMAKIMNNAIPLTLCGALLLSGCNGASTTEPNTQEPDIIETQEPDIISGGCPFSGSVSYSLNGSESWPSEVVTLLTTAMDEGIWYYNCYADLSHNLTVNYDPGVPTAQANVDGWMTFGSSRSYMVVATAMHEIGHTMGVGFYPWTELTDSNKRWTGPAVQKLMDSMPQEERDPGERDYITADGQHFWPYGLNYASEHVSEWSLINHVRVVAAMQEDKGNY